MKRRKFFKALIVGLLAARTARANKPKPMMQVVSNRYGKTYMSMASQPWPRKVYYYSYKNDNNE